MLDFIAHKLDVYNNRRLADYGVTHSQAKVLVRIFHAKDNRIPQTELQKFGRQKSTITSLLANLEKGEFIYREASETDARAKYVGLTERGYAIALVALGNIENADTIIDSALTKEEAMELQRLLQKVADTLHNKLCCDNDFTDERNDNT